MKKILCVVLAALLLFGCVAIAEEVPPAGEAPADPAAPFAPADPFLSGAPAEVSSIGLAAAPIDGVPVETLVYDELTVITYQVPEGFTVETSEMLDTTAHICVMKDAFQMDLLIAHDEEYAGLEKLNDLSEEELDQYAASLTEDWLNPQVQILETAYGTKFVVIREDVDAEMDMGIVTGIYKGFVVNVTLLYEDGLKLDASDFDAAMSFLSEVWIKDAE